jgi:hypothetical protein
MSEEIALAIADLETAKELWAALTAVDKHRVGAYETDSGSVEPCDECGEMRDIAAQALAAYDEAVTAQHTT